MESGSITNIRYELITELGSKKHAVEVYFLFEGKPTKRIYYFRNKRNFDYVEETKKIVEKELANGKLVKYAREYHNVKVHKHLALKIVTPVVALVAFTSAGLYAFGKYNDAPVFPIGQKVKVDPRALDKDGKEHKIVLSNRNAIVGETYETTITLAENDSAYTLPSRLDQVVSYTDIITKDNYSYDITDVDRTQAILKIPAGFVKGPVTIDLTIQERPVGVSMEVSTLKHCNVMYKGTSLKEGQIVDNLLQDEMEFDCEPTLGYALTEKSFKIKYLDGDDVSHQYDSEHKKLTLTNISGDFTFSIEGVDPEGTVPLTVNYSSEVYAVYYKIDDDNKVKLDENKPFPITFSTYVHLSVEMDESEPLFPNEITCSLEGAKIDIQSPYAHNIIIDTRDCVEQGFSVDIHVKEYNPISNVKITKNENCKKIYVYDRNEDQFVEVISDTIDINPTVSESLLTIVLRVETKGSKLTKDDIILNAELEYVEKNVSYVVGDLYEVRIASNNFSQLDNNEIIIQPAPIQTVKATVFTNEHAIVTYKGIPLSNEPRDVAPVEKEGYKVVAFGVETLDEFKLAKENIWSSFGTVSIVPTPGSTNLYELRIASVDDFESFSLNVTPGDTKGIKTKFETIENCNVFYNDKEIRAGETIYTHLAGPGDDYLYIYIATAENMRIKSVEQALSIYAGYDKIKDENIQLTRIYGNQYKVAIFLGDIDPESVRFEYIKASHSDKMFVTGSYNENCSQLTCDDQQFEYSGDHCSVRLMENRLTFRATVINGATLSKDNISEMHDISFEAHIDSVTKGAEREGKVDYYIVVGIDINSANEDEYLIHIWVDPEVPTP